MTQYIPSGKTVQAVIQSLNDFTPHEISLPGNWSPHIFFTDLKTYPVPSKQLLTTVLVQANKSPMTYIDFFLSTRPGTPFPHIKNEYHTLIWQLFDKESLMLYFEDYFRRLVKEESRDVLQSHDILLQYIDCLSKAPIGEWDTIVIKLGACCFQFFAKNPELYQNIELSDSELLEKLGLMLSPTPYPGKISIHDSRPQLLQLYAASGTK